MRKYADITLEEYVGLRKVLGEASPSYNEANKYFLATHVQKYNNKILWVSKEDGITLAPWSI